MDWAKVAWKGMRATLAGAAAVALYAGAEVVLSGLDTAGELSALGVPAVAIPVLLGLGAAARNWLKHRNTPTK